MPKACGSTSLLSGTSKARLRHSAWAKRIWASLATFIVNRICAICLPGVCDWTCLAWASCSSVTWARSSSNCSTLLRGRSFLGVKSCTTSSIGGGGAVSAAASSASRGPSVAVELDRRPNILLFLGVTAVCGARALLDRHLQLEAEVFLPHDNRLGLDLFDNEAIDGLAQLIERVVDQAGFLR